MFKKIISLLLTIAVICALDMITVSADTYTPIYSIEDLYNIRANPSDNYRLMNDIDLSETVKGGDWDFGNGWFTIPKFSGTFEGNGYSLLNINIFGNLDYGSFINSNYGTIQNLNVYNFNINGDINNGSFINANHGTVKNLKVVSMNIKGKIKKAGFVNTNAGYLEQIKIYNSNVSIENCDYFGTVCARNNSIVDKCFSDGNIYIDNSKYLSDRENTTSRIGGICGHNYSDSSISMCYNLCDINIDKVTNSENYDDGAGGICGYTGCYMSYTDSTSKLTTSPSTITDCYNGGTISSGGGICFINGGSIKRCINYKDGKIYGVVHTTELKYSRLVTEIIGGIIAETRKSFTETYTGSWSNCYAMLNSSFGEGGKALANQQIKFQSSFLDLDFENTWEMSEENKRPELKNNKEVKIEKASLISKPNKIVYICGEEFDPEGAQLLIEYNDETYFRTSVCKNMIGEVDMNKLGEQTVSIIYGDIINYFDIVVNPIFVNAIKLSDYNIEIVKGENLKLVVTITPENATNKDVRWKSSNESIATVDENGLITAISGGKVTITAETTDNSGLSASCEVTVHNYIDFSPSNLQSEHNYLNNTDETKEFRVPGAYKLVLTFDEKTSVERYFDYIYIYDNKNNLVGTYTDKELAGQKIEINGDLVKIKLVSDSYTNDWGYNVVSVTAIIDELLGDIDKDGVISINDVTEIQKYLASLSNLSDNQIILADFNKDGIISISDATEIQKYIVGLV